MKCLIKSSSSVANNQSRGKPAVTNRQQREQEVGKGVTL